MNRYLRHTRIEMNKDNLYTYVTLQDVSQTVVSEPVPVHGLIYARPQMISSIDTIYAVILCFRG